MKNIKIRFNEKEFIEIHPLLLIILIPIFTILLIYIIN